MFRIESKGLELVVVLPRWFPIPPFLFFLLLILERGEGRKKERKRNIDARDVSGLPPADAPDEDWTLNPGACPDQE